MGTVRKLDDAIHEVLSQVLKAMPSQISTHTKSTSIALSEALKASVESSCIDAARTIVEACAANDIGLLNPATQLTRMHSVTQACLESNWLLAKQLIEDIRSLPSPYVTYEHQQTQKKDIDRQKAQKEIVEHAVPRGDVGCIKKQLVDRKLLSFGSGRLWAWVFSESLRFRNDEIAMVVALKSYGAYNQEDGIGPRLEAMRHSRAAVISALLCAEGPWNDLISFPREIQLASRTLEDLLCKLKQPETESHLQLILRCFAYHAIHTTIFSS